MTRLDRVREELAGNPSRERWLFLKQLETTLLREKINYAFASAARRTARYEPYHSAVVQAYKIGMTELIGISHYPKIKRKVAK